MSITWQGSTRWEGPERGLPYTPGRIQISLREKIPLCCTLWRVSIIRCGFSLHNFTPPSYSSHLFPSEIYLILLEKENWSKWELFQHLLMLNHDYISPVLFTLQRLAIPSKALNFSWSVYNLFLSHTHSPCLCLLLSPRERTPDQLMALEREESSGVLEYSHLCKKPLFFYQLKQFLL